MTSTARVIALVILFATPAFCPAQSYWIGRQPDPKTDEFVFDVPVPADLAAQLVCTDPKGAKFKSGVREFKWEVGGTAYTFFQNDVSWDGNRIDTGSFAYFRESGVQKAAWVHSDPRAAGYKAVRDVLVAQKKPWDTGWFEVSPILLRTEGKNNPRLTVNFNADAPFGITRHPLEYDTAIGAAAPTKKPQIVPVVRGDTLFIAYQTWGQSKPTDKVVIVKVPLGNVSKKKLTTHRTVPSGGVLVGFTVDDKGRDFTLTAKAEEFPNNPTGDFVEAIAKTRRMDVFTLHSGATATDLNTDTYTAKPVFGVCNAGSGRLAAGAGDLAAVFARRHYSRENKIIHQEADSMLLAADSAKVLLKAQNSASHSFDQRLLFDGTDFVSLHQGDQYPVAGLIVEKILINPRNGRAPGARFAAFACPTSGNNVYYELGALAAEEDGYPVLFAATRNTEEVSPKTAEEKGRQPWELGMVYVRRGFQDKAQPKNPYDIVGSGVLAGGYAKPETLTFDNLSWDPATSMFSKRESRTVTRQVAWLTSYSDNKGPATRASAPKLVQLAPGKYVAVWEEQALTGRGWEYRRTMTNTITITGGPDDKQIVPGTAVPLAGTLRLHRGDDAFALLLDGQRTAAWVTAGETNRQLTLHTVSDDLKYTAIPLALP